MPQSSSADSQLQASLLAAIVESSDDAIISTDLDGLVTSWNEGAQQLFGYSPAEMIGQSVQRLFTPERHAEEGSIQARIRKGERVEHFETRKLAKGNRAIEVSVTMSPVRDGGGTVIGISRINRDISALKARERELDTLSKLYASLSQVNQAIVTSPDRGRLLPRVCRALVNHGVFTMAWIGLEDPATHELVPSASAGDDQNLMGNVTIYTDDRPEGRGPSGTAFRTNMPVICNDIGAEPALEPWRAQFGAQRYKSLAAFPIRQAQEPVGILAVYSDQVGFFREREVELLIEAAGDVSFAIENFARDHERRHAAAQAQRERLFSQAMFDSMPGILYLYDDTGRFLRWNRRFETATGRTAAELETTHPLDLFRGDDRERVASRIGEVFEKGESSVEASLIRKDGTATPYYFTGLKIDFEGRRCVVGVGIDISARVQAEAEQRESEERFRATFEQAAVGIAHVGTDGRFMRVNEKLCEITGYPREELLQKTIADLNLPEYRAEAEEARQAMMGGRRNAWSAEKQYARKDGSHVWVSVITTLLRDPDGKPKYFIAVTADISERKALEERFLRSQRMESLGALAGGIAHDFNNLLSPVLMGVELLRLEKLPPNTVENLKGMESSARRGAELVKQLLSFARGVHGATMTVQVTHIIREMERFVQSTFPKNITFRTTVPRGLWPVQGDPTQLNQIILNLCVNARDAMPDGGTLTLGAENLQVDEAYAAMQSEVAPGNYLKIITTDTGTGIPAAVIEKIFEPFFTTKAPGKGTGLGLSTVRQIVRNAGGHISLRSVEGKGTTFEILIPASPDAAESTATQVAAPTKGRNETILVAESDASVLSSVVKTLGAFGYNPVAAPDGAEAIAEYAVRGKDIALVVVDLARPLMPAKALVKVLRRLNPGVKILVTSGLADEAEVPADTGEILRKPYSGGELLNAIRKTLDG